MPIYSRKNSPYLVIEFEYRGQRYSRSSGTANKRDAKAAEAAWRAEIVASSAAGASGKRPEIMLHAALSRYLEEVAAFQASQDDAARTALRLAEGLADQNLAHSIRDSLSRYVAKRRGQKARHQKRLVSNATVNREIEFLRRVLRKAEDGWGMAVDMPRWGDYLLPESDEREVSASPEALARLFAALRSDYHDLFAGALASGLRLDNLITLEWHKTARCHVDLEAGLVRLRVKSKQQDGRVVELPLRGQFLDIVKRCQGQHPRFVFTYLPYRRRRAGGGTVIEFRRPFTAYGWRKDFLRARKTAGLPNLRFHDLRHLFGNALYKATGNLRQVQKAMGHADVQSTMRYLHADQADLAAALDHLDLPIPTLAAPISIDQARQARRAKGA